MSDNRVRVKEAIAHAKSKGIKVKIGKLANKTMLNAPSVDSAYQRFHYLEIGETKSIDKRTVGLICKELRVDANFLYDTPPMESEE